MQQENEQFKQENRALIDERDALLDQVAGMRMQSRRAKVRFFVDGECGVGVGVYLLCPPGACAEFVCVCVCFSKPTRS